MEIFACGEHLPVHKTTSSALNSQFQSAMKKLPQMSTFITKSFLDHSTGKNCQNLCLRQANLLGGGQLKKSQKKSKSISGILGWVLTFFDPKF